MRPQNNTALAKIMIENKVLSKEEVNTALASLERETPVQDLPKAFSEYLVEKRLISPDVLNKVMVAWRVQLRVKNAPKKVLIDPREALKRRVEERKRAGRTASTIKVIEQTVVRSKPDEKKKATDEALKADSAYVVQEKIKKFIESVARSRRHIKILEFIEKGNVTIVSTRRIAKKVEEKPADLRKVWGDWEQAGLLKNVAPDTFNYAPSLTEKDDIKEFLNSWHDREGHAALLDHVLEEEKKALG